MFQNARKERFRFIKMLGAGAFARTLLVEDLKNPGQQIAIKVPHDSDKELALVKEIVQNGLLRGSLGMMEHPNIVKFLDLDKYEGFYVMMMEYVPGVDLRNIIGPVDQVRQPIAIDDALRIFCDCCNGVGAAHRINLVHRDIKPENILIRQPDAVAKLVDFGIARVKQSSTGLTIAGTFPYMAPEALNGKTDISVDLWSLTVTLYEMVTGRLPFFGDTFAELQRQIVLETPAIPSSFNKKVTAQMDAVLMKGLDKDPRKRFQTAEEMVRALEPSFEDDIAKARALFTSGREQEAEDMIRALSTRNPKVPLLKLALAEIVNRRGRAAEGLQILRSASKAHPENGQLHFQLALALSQDWAKNGREALDLLAAAQKAGLPSGLDKQAGALLKAWGKRPCP